MLVKRENKKGIYLLYKNSFNKNFVVALPEYVFYVVKGRILSKLSIEQVAQMLNQPVDSIYDEYNKLYGSPISQGGKQAK